MAASSKEFLEFQTIRVYSERVFDMMKTRGKILSCNAELFLSGE